MSTPAESLSNLLFFDKNTYRLWIVLFVSYYTSSIITDALLSIQNIILMIFISIIFALVIDFFYYFLHINYYDPPTAVIRGYCVSGFCNDTLHSKGIDYGFNFYDGDYNKTARNAQIDKFKYAIKQLNIKKGDSVIDVGCGCGDWLSYLQNEMKCTVVGINITEMQALECRARGLTCYTTDWKDIAKNEKLKAVLYNKFDFVSFWDTVEHYVAMGEGLNRRKRRAVVYQNMFKLADNLLTKSDSNVETKNRIWISCLHMRKRVFSYKYLLHPVKYIDQFKKMLYLYIVDKFHSGFYPSYYHEVDGKFHDELVDNAKVIGYDLFFRKDVTLDYYMTSIINATHFGRHRFKLTFKRFVALICSYFLDPYWIHRIIWYFQESWMLQFNPNDINDSDTILWWLVLEKAK